MIARLFSVILLVISAFAGLLVVGISFVILSEVIGMWAWLSGGVAMIIGWVVFAALVNVTVWICEG